MDIVERKIKKTGSHIKKKTKYMISPASSQFYCMGHFKSRYYLKTAMFSI